MHHKYCQPLQTVSGVNADNKYKNGKIYKIEPINSLDIGDIYIGSTTKTLEKRMYGHLHTYVPNQLTSTKLFRKYGVENCQISLIEKFPCTSRKELFTREAFYINSLSCVNIHMKINVMDTNDQKKFGCIDCGYYTNLGSNIKRHNLSKNHLLKISPEVEDPSCKYQCKVCYKIYNSQPGLWSHNKKCKPHIIVSVENACDTAQTIPELSKKIDRLENIILEMAKNQQKLIDQLVSMSKNDNSITN